MPLILNLDVQWQSGRLVHVRCVGLPLVADRSYRGPADKEVSIDHGDVASLGSFHDYLAMITRPIPDGGSVAVLGFEPEIVEILQLLDIEGPPPDPIILKLENP